MDRAEELLERIAVGVEKLGEEPSFEIPSSPPVCPHCGVFDPEVQMQESGGIGKLSSVFFEVVCQKCSTKFFVVPQGWTNFTTMGELTEFFERADDGNSRETD